MKKIFHLIAPIILAVSFTTPLFASALSCQAGYVERNDGSGCDLIAIGGSGNINQQWTIYYRDLIVWAINSVLVPILIAIAFIVFLWGVYKYFIYGADNDAEREKGKQFVLWGIIGLVVILSVWGLVNIVKDTLVPSSAGSNHPAYPTL